ncbi:HPr-rel-A system PqqD family peptide chaperone [bacterium]|nr:HPr-rel-A system PqqD family peptide chaperone [bacterium]
MSNIQTKSETTLLESGFLFDHASGLSYTVNGTAHLIFNALKEEKDTADILDELEKTFDIDRETAQNDLDDFLHNLKSIGLIEL